MKRLLLELKTTDAFCMLCLMGFPGPLWPDAQAQTRLKALVSQRQALVYSIGYVKSHSRDAIMAHSSSQLRAVWDCMSLIEPELTKCIAQMAGWLE